VSPHNGTIKLQSLILLKTPKRVQKSRVFEIRRRGVAGMPKTMRSIVSVGACRFARSRAAVELEPNRSSAELRK